MQFLHTEAAASDNMLIQDPSHHNDPDLLANTTDTDNLIIYNKSSTQEELCVL
jgi:hypothetical protein